MGLTTKKQKIAANLPKTLSSSRFGVWFLAYKPNPARKLGTGLSRFRSKIDAWAENIRQVPLKRYLFDLYSLGPAQLVIYVLSYMFSSFQPALQLYYSNRLFSVLEATLASGKPDARQTTMAVVMRVFGIVLIACCQWTMGIIRPMYLERVRAHFMKRAMEAHLRQDLLSSQSKNSVLENDTHEIASDMLDGLLNLWHTTASTVSQVVVVLQILRGREGGAMLLLLCLAQPIFRSLTQRSLWDIAGVYWMHDEWFLRARALFDIAVQGRYRQEVLSGTMSQYLTREYEKTEKHTTAGPDDNLFMAFNRSRTPFPAIFVMLLEDLPLLYLAFSSVRHPEKFSIASLAILTQTSSALRNAWYNVFDFNTSIAGYFGSLTRMYAGLDLKTDFDTGTTPYPSAQSRPSQGMEISLRDVTFHYPGTEEGEKPRAALHDVSFALPASSMVVIVGENGSGKTSLVKILSGLYRPTAGDVFIDGINAKEYKVADLAKVTALLTQENAIFPLDIAENIAIGDPDCEPGKEMERIKEAAELGGAAKFIEKFEYGYEEVLENVSTAEATRYPLDGELAVLQKLLAEVERDKEISGGEKQRLAAARTFMRLKSGRMKLLVVDEPTSAMDPAAEFRLFERLRAMRTGKTVVFVTHRFGHLTKHADLILCMRDGEVVESGTHKELIEKMGEYQRLYNIQAQAFVET